MMLVDIQSNLIKSKTLLFDYLEFARAVINPVSSLKYKALVHSPNILTNYPA